MMRIFVFIALLLGGFFFQGCIEPDPQEPGIEYAPNMWHPTSYHPLREYDRDRLELNPHGRNMRKPPEGTVARGKKDHFYPYPDTDEGYEQAGEELENPLPADQEILDEGERLYTKFCQNCHGEKGLGDGPVASQEPGDGLYPGVAALNSRAVRDNPPGQIYHVITYGRGLMGAHKGQLDPEQRWKIVHYVRKLQRYDEQADEFVEREALEED